MGKHYIVKSQVTGHEETSDVFLLSEPRLTYLIKIIEAHKEIYERVIIYEEDTGDAVYWYNGKKR